MLLLPLVLVAACIYDDQDRCGPNQELSGRQACVCKPGLVLVGTNCEPCPEHEQEVGGACECEEGYERPAQGQACAAIVEGGLGARCSASEPCVDDVFDVCRASGVAGPYCTKLGCEADDDCDLGYACNKRGEESFCERPPLGQGSDCDTSADCAGGDASFCEAFVNHVCLVHACSLEQNDCFAGWECCDLSGVGLPGLPGSVCAPEGECP